MKVSNEKTLTNILEMNGICKKSVNKDKLLNTILNLSDRHIKRLFAILDNKYNSRLIKLGENLEKIDNVFRLLSYHKPQFYSISNIFFYHIDRIFVNKYTLPFNQNYTMVRNFIDNECEEYLRNRYDFNKIICKELNIFDELYLIYYKPIIVNIPEKLFTLYVYYLDERRIKTIIIDMSTKIVFENTKKNIKSIRKNYHRNEKYYYYIDINFTNKIEKDFIISFKDCPFLYKEIYSMFGTETLIQSCKKHYYDVQRAYCVIFCWKLLQYKSSIGILPCEIMLIISVYLSNMNEMNE
jgi:hypothetical protein